MAEQPDNIVLEILKSIREDQSSLRSEMSGLRAEVNLKIGTLAQGMVSLTNTVEGLRTDVRMIALAVDEHTHRLDKIEAHLAITH